MSSEARKLAGATKRRAAAIAGILRFLGDRMPEMGSEGLGARFFRQVVDALGEPAFIKDRQFRFVFVNKALCEMVGFSPAEMVGRTDYDFFSRTEADFFRTKDEEVFTTGASVVVEQEPVTDAKGTRHVLRTHKAPLRSPEGDITHLVGVIHDITVLKAAEDALRTNNQELERRVEERTKRIEAMQTEVVLKEKLAMLGELAGGVAHQLRNPLGIINNAAHVLEREIGPALGGRALRIIHDEVARANRIVSALLEYGRQRPVDRRALSVAYLVAQALGAQEIPTAVQIVQDVPDHLLVLADAGQTQSALFNLIANAFEAMPAGGTLMIDAEEVGQEIMIALTDTGLGVEPDWEARLFEPLQTTKSSGLGLGLVTARRLVECQGGSLVFAGNTPAGTRFEVRLAKAEPKDG